MGSTPFPSWLRWHGSNTPLLVLAPHGGTRHPSRGDEIGRGRKVNDLHTASLAHEIATDLGASYIINDHLDRNVVDLNRLSQVHRAAPWFLALVERLLAEILERHAVAEVLVVHGWNVVQAKCDFGLGLRAGDVADVIAGRASETQTISSDYLRNRLAPLRALLRQAGIETAVGQRYPARHPDNLLQLFRRGADAQGAHVSQLRAWTAAGRIEAVQWELGIPLRWPGPMRRRLRGAIRAAFDPARPMLGPEVREPATTRLALAPPASLRFFDAATGIGLMAGVDPAPPPRGGAQGRVLLFLDGERIALFTGDHAAKQDFAAEGPLFEPLRDGFRFTFRGSTLETENGRDYLDLERALSRSRLRRLRIELTFAARTPGIGRAHGAVEVDARRWRVDCAAFADPSAWRRPPGSRRSEWAISAALDDESVLLGDSGARRLRWLTCGRGGEHEVSVVRIPLEGDGYTPRRFDLHFAAARRLRLEPLSRISILRPIGRERSVRVTLGVARAFVDDGERAGSALYEYTRLFTR